MTKITPKSTGKTCSPGELMITDAGVTHCIEVTNTSADTLYVQVYNLGPCWNITDVLHSRETIPPKDLSIGLTGTFRKKIKTYIPDELLGQGVTECEDVIKVFVTSQPTSLSLFEMPKLGEIGLRHRRASTAINYRGEGVAGESEGWAVLDFCIRTIKR
ncbi:hypothetical protein BJY04DRAFT_20818 [Aspergillus karnatakaensis]|uniref:uncharacterized protein n=1 Tax=Aspergillus karnatakaensis TaxID=1810916 RepID=UPI003CCD37B9